MMEEVGQMEVVEGPAAQHQQQQQNVITRDDEDQGEKELCPEEPAKKKVKRSSSSTDQSREEKLESRLGSVLCCAVCLDLPRYAIHQCTNGHLMCLGCLHHILADARIRDEQASCPNCRVEITKNTATRNLAVEKALNELPAECQYCSREFPRNSLERHEKELCEERTISCIYGRIGCIWRGPYHERAAHQENCSHPKKSGAEVMEFMNSQELELDVEKNHFTRLFNLLSFEKIQVNEVQLKPYRTDEFVQKLYYESTRFGCFNGQWVIKAKVVTNNPRDPTQSCEREIHYQLILKSKPATSFDISWIILKSPFADLSLIKSPIIQRFEFLEQNSESPYFKLPLHDSNECNRLLSGKTIHLRLIAFQQ